MSLVKLANGQKYEIEAPAAVGSGVLRQRERKILPLVFKADVSEFEAIKAAFRDPANTETLVVYFPDEKPGTSDEVLDAPNGPAKEVYEGFTILGESKEEETVVTLGTSTAPPVYGRRLTIELGQRQYGE